MGGLLTAVGDVDGAKSSIESSLAGAADAPTTDALGASAAPLATA